MDDWVAIGKYFNNQTYCKNDMISDYKVLSLCKGIELVLCADGSYTVRNTDASIEYPDTSKSFLIQCYSNGYVNKVPVDDLISLRYNYKYSHGIFPLKNLLASCIVSTEDSIGVKYVRNGTECTASVDIGTLKTHSMLGLKGVDVIGTAFDEITGWYLNGELIDFHLESMQPRNQNKDDASQTPMSITSNTSDLSKDENDDELKERFSSYLESGRNIPIGQKYAKEVLAQCQTKEEFWQIIKTLLNCSTKVYRSPIVDYLNEHDITQFMPNIEMLSPICEALFSVTDKPEKNLEFLYHFKDVLTDEIRDRIVNSINSLAQPNQYFKLCDMLGMSKNGIIEYCIKQSNPASYYCVYEMLLKVREKEGHFAANKLIDTFINSLDDTSIRGKLIKHLIDYVFNTEKSNPDAKVTKIKTGGFNEYLRLCTAQEGKKKQQTIQDTITSNVGKTIEGKYVATFSNHYFLITSNGLRILLPKTMSEKELLEGDKAKVEIVFVDKKYNTLYATQKKSVDYAKIMQMPLLNNGDVIEISFDIRGVPIPHKCYKKIKVNLVSYPKEIDNKIRYKAKVIRQTTDKYHYLVTLIK